MLFGGVVLVVAYFIFLCCRAGIECCRKEAGCGPNLSRFILFIFATAMLVMMACSFVGYTNFMSGVEGVANNAASLKKLVARLEDGAQDLSNQGTRFVTQTQKADCTNSTYDEMMTKSAEVFNNYADSYSKIIPESRSLIRIRDVFSDIVPEYVTYFLGFAFSLAAVGFLLTIFGLCCKSAALLNFASFIGIVTLLLLILTISFELTMSVMFADFCYYGPNRAVYEMSMNYQPRTANVVQYYTICDGTNPLQTMLNKTSVALGNIKNATRHIKVDNCDEEGAYQQIKITSVEATSTIANLTSAQDCDVVNDIYFDMVDEVLCDKTVQGLWQLWATHMAAAALMYINLYFTSFVKQKCKVNLCLNNSRIVFVLFVGLFKFMVLRIFRY